MGLTVGCCELEAILDCLLATAEGGGTKPVLATLGKQSTVLLLRGEGVSVLLLPSLN